MSVSGIPSNNLNSQSEANAVQSRFQHIKLNFQQIGQDLQSGNLSQAQSDFAALQQFLPSNQTAASTSSQPGTFASSPLGKAVSQLVNGFNSVVLNASPTEPSATQQGTAQIAAPQGTGNPHAHRHHGTALLDSAQASAEQNALSTLFSQLGQAIQGGNLSTAQSAYASLQQEFQTLGLGSPSAASVPAATSAALSLSA